MAENIINFIKTLTGNEVLTVIILSVIPFIEIRGALPFALGMGVAPFDAWLLCAVTATLAIPLLLLLFAPTLEFLKKSVLFRRIIASVVEIIDEKCKKLIARSLSRQKRKSKKAASGAQDGGGIKYGLLFFLSALPVPLTGIWTDCAVAVFLKLDKLRAFAAIALGNLLSSALIALLLRFFVKQMPLILNGVILSIAAVFIYTLARIILKSRKKLT
jgi:uncharacterized membrane protein